MARPELGSPPWQRASAASAYRQGNTGRPMGQGESLATSADPFVQRQSLGRETSDRESRQAHARGGPGDLEHPNEEGGGHPRVTAKGLPASTPPRLVHSKEARTAML